MKVSTFLQTLAEEEQAGLRSEHHGADLRDLTDPRHPKADTYFEALGRELEVQPLRSSILPR